MQEGSIVSPVTETPERRAFYQKIDEKNLTALWLSLAELVTTEPRSNCRPALWGFGDIRSLMLEAGELITAKEAERRVLVLENPGLRGQSKITTDLYAGVQLVMPGEVAPAHRHTQSALRFILEGEGGYTAVNGERTLMHEGDFIITPPWAWHDHGNPSADPIFWLDGLDIPVIQMLDASFAEHLHVDQQPITRPVGDSDARYGYNLLPVDHESARGSGSVFNYPYARTREALERLRRSDRWDPCHGLKMRYTNPITGNHAMATIGTFIQLLPKGFAGSGYRSTDATVFVPIEGRGRSYIASHSGDEFVVDWSKRDIFVVPSWHWIRHETTAMDAVLFSYSDRPIQEALHVFREDRGNV
ncbi:gentisate 1,2-dioxygenase [Bradyrhizobium sp. KB893862 SZCCT0404]|uniref:gentisate 1,2-dioxygenase n=1 Tax=Bradyrhizobium sp. KB893862 SZCCT0404 TaxID=2807672 RepID=UPI001BA5333A|nr:gentisate 1,2-dioxygenase [Bradyrhizobium sp. KB893862 SZCCT0404]MBR1177179.1 gentisate 1,2-dioxygenase [Bradyrhizobium sp. KB893862 SZCCT0404]